MPTAIMLYEEWPREQQGRGITRPWLSLRAGSWTGHIGADAAGARARVAGQCMTTTGTQAARHARQLRASGHVSTASSHGHVRRRWVGGCSHWRRRVARGKCPRVYLVARKWESARRICCQVSTC
jgi:hypothetical protein